MRTVRFSSLAVAGATLFLALAISTSTATAASTFLLQFGAHPTEEAARQQWDRLQSQNPELLGNMDVRVAPVGGEFRTQASGVTSREQAQSTCNRLVSKDVTCMVVETSMYMPADGSPSDANYAPLAPVEENISVEMVSDDMDGVTIDDSAALSAQPALVNAQPAAPQEKSLRETLLPWLTFGKDKKEQPAEAPRQVRIIDNDTQQQAAPVAQVQTANAQPAPRPERVKQPAWPETIDRSQAANLSESLPAQKPALRPGETRTVASRAPRPLQAPQQQAPQQQAPAAEPQLTPQTVTGQAEVEIAEAIQVPLSFGNAAPVPVNKPVGHAGFPSQPLPARAIWVQLSSFASKEAAMSYWRQLSAQNPEMMRLLRVRIISPWRRPGAGIQRSASLRMGPFTDQNSIIRLCNNAAQNKLRCTTVQEVGSSATANVIRRPTNVENYNRRTATSRGYSSTAGARPAGMYWVQLGAFNTVNEAQKRWSEMNTVHSDILGRMQPQISYPALSSSPTPVYHLRTGPFVSQSSATSTCNSLQSRRVGCVIVQAR